MRYDSHFVTDRLADMIKYSVQELGSLLALVTKGFTGI